MFPVHCIVCICIVYRKSVTVWIKRLHTCILGELSRNGTAQSGAQSLEGLLKAHHEEPKDHSRDRSLQAGETRDIYEHCLQ